MKNCKKENKLIPKCYLFNVFTSLVINNESINRYVRKITKPSTLAIQLKFFWWNPYRRIDELWTNSQFCVSWDPLRYINGYLTYSQPNPSNIEFSKMLKQLYNEKSIINHTWKIPLTFLILYSEAGISSISNGFPSFLGGWMGWSIIK